MYGGDEAIRLFAELYGIPEPEIRLTRDEFYSRASLDIRRLPGLDQAMADAVEYRFISKVLTPGQLDDLFKYRFK